MSDLRFWQLSTMGDDSDPDLCVIDTFVDGIGAESWRVHLGESLLPVYPRDAKITLTGEESGIKLMSLVGNTACMLLVSKDLKEIVQTHATGQIEYLPIAIHDHRKRALNRDYFLVNPVGTFDCLDLAASDIAYSKKDPKKIVKLRTPVLDPAKVARAPQLFRIKEDPGEYVIGRKLARAIYDRDDITNIVWDELKTS